MSDQLVQSPRAVELEPWINMDVDCVVTAPGASPPNVAKSPDEWKHIADSTQRKKVQNRNAQRIYRHKLKRRIAELERINSRLVSRQSTCSPRLQASMPSLTPPRARRASSLSSCDFEKTSYYNNDHALTSIPPLLPTAPPSLFIAPTTDDRGFSPQPTWPGDAITGFDHLTDMNSILNHTPIHSESSIPFFSLDFPCDQSSTCSLDQLSSLASTSYSSSPAYSSPASSYCSSYSAAAAATTTSMPLNDGRTTLHLAVEQGRLPVISMLLAQHADLYAQDFCGATALHIAAARGSAAATSLLLDAAANTDDNSDDSNPQSLKMNVASQRDMGGATPLHLAAAGGHEGAVAALLGFRRATSPSSPGSNVGDMNTSPPFSDANAVDHSRQTPLHLAAAAGNEAVVQMLLDAGADMRTKAANGYTALHVAGCAGHERIVELLLRRGAEVDCRIEV
ncbi:ankyrin repeat-containing domain protein [Phaeosphaeriaceae sp. PMI808]|nr:ankyrin repeat-containing domain protein [Phaeosphaeriaceae sp. PMI808]